MVKKRYILTQTLVDKFIIYLKLNERSRATIEKYQRDIKKFMYYLPKNCYLNKLVVLNWKESLIQQNYAVSSINSMLAAINSLFHFLNWEELRVKQMKIQRQPFRQNEKDLSRAEYRLLLQTAKERKNMRLYFILQTICSTGLRVSELSFVSVEAVNRGTMTVSLKGKSRIVFLPQVLCVRLRRYIKENGIKKGSIFLTHRGKPISRHQIWVEMKNLAKFAKVETSKVFPHNLRHLFALCYYSQDKDLAKLADLLGHSSLETTRLYVVMSGSEHEKLINRMKLIE